MSLKKFLPALLAVFIFVYSSPPAADLSGVIKDNNTGSPVLGVIVKVVETGQMALTNIFGEYMITGLPDGEYTLIVGKDNYSTQIITGVNIGFCCIGITGNIDNDITETIDVSDLVYFVDYQFRGGAAPVCMEEAELNGDLIIDVADLVYMVDYQFRGGATPINCHAIN